MHDRYGRHEFGQHCLLARRLLEAGVNCVRVTHFDWDAHQVQFLLAPDPLRGV